MLILFHYNRNTFHNSFIENNKSSIWKEMEDLLAWIYLLGNCYEGAADDGDGDDEPDRPLPVDEQREVENN